MANDFPGKGWLNVRRFLFLIIGALLASALGCAKIKSDPNVDYRTTTGIAGDPYSAEAHFQEALQLICEHNYNDAEQALHQSLICDDTFGPAHNALGKIYFHQSKYYLAAWEFEHANRLMPGRPEPVNNLGLVYEAVGHVEKSIHQFYEAYSIEETNPQYLGNLLRARIRKGETSADIHALLNKLVLIDDRPEWRDWARDRLELYQYDQPEVLLPYEEEITPIEESQPTRQRSENISDTMLLPIPIEESPKTRSPK